jgi:hypothetical protein
MFAGFSSTAFSNEINYNFKNGNVNFDVGVSVSFLNIHGTAQIDKGDVKLIKRDRELLIRKIYLKFSPKKMKTGMAVRDEHMIERVFTSDNGSVQDIKISGKNITCPLSGSSYKCLIPLKTKLRGKISTVRVKANLVFDESNNMKVNFDGHIDISKFGVKKISQFGVKVKNKVKIYTKTGANFTPSNRVGSKSFVGINKVTKTKKN